MANDEKDGFHGAVSFLCSRARKKGGRTRYVLESFAGMNGKPISGIQFNHVAFVKGWLNLAENRLRSKRRDAKERLG